MSDKPDASELGVSGPNIHWSRLGEVIEGEEIVFTMSSGYTKNYVRQEPDFKISWREPHTCARPCWHDERP